jgi:hypothetical protein
LGLYRCIANSLFAVVHVTPTGVSKAKSGLFPVLEIARSKSVEERQHEQPRRA